MTPPTRRSRRPPSRSSFHPGLTPSRFLESQAVTRAHEQAFVVTGLPPASSERPLTSPISTAAIAPVAVPATAVPAPSVPSPAAPAPPVSTPVPASAGGVAERVARLPMKWVAAGVAAVTVLALAAWMLTGGTPAMGTAVIDAAPWANITEIRNEDGELQPLPSPASTPLSVALPAGTYQISLAGPPPESKNETVTLRVEVGQTSVVPITHFQSLSVEEYFEEYLRTAYAVNRVRVVLVVICACAVPSFAAAQDDAFKQGLQARGDKKWADVVRHMQNALKSDAQESTRKVRPASRRGRHGVSAALLPGRGVLQPAGLRRRGQRMVGLRAAGRDQEQA